MDKATVVTARRIGRVCIPWLVWMLFGAALAASATTGQSAEPTSVPTFASWLPISNHNMVVNPVRQGEATYYDATGDGSCMFGPSPNDLMVAAMNSPDFNNAAVCGEYVRVTGPKGVVTVKIVDLCPGCSSGMLDLSQEAFARIASLPQGRVPVTWQVVSPELSGPIAYQFKSGSSRWWTAVQVRNHRNPVAKFEYLSAGGVWVEVPRTAYNYFVQSSGMGPGPYTFRVTDSYGNTLTDSNIPLTVGGTVDGAKQFPPLP